MPAAFDAPYVHGFDIMFSEQILRCYLFFFYFYLLTIDYYYTFSKHHEKISEFKIINHRLL